MRLVKTCAALVLVSLLSACSWWSENANVEPDIPEQQLYEEALGAMDDGNYSLAVDKLQLLEARYPFGRYSEQAQLELIYAYFKTFEPDSASAAADRFIRLHPNHDNVDYAYYMKGLTAFEKDRSFLTRYLPLDETQRDPGAARDSFDSFATLVDRYPESEYAPDAQKRMQYLKNRLATHEIHVATYYMKRQAWIAAANRGRYVVENYQETPAVADALAIMHEAYNQVGLTDLANDAMEVLTLNFPDYEIHSFREGSSSLLNIATFGLLGESEDVAVPARPTQSLGETRAEERVKEDAKEERSWFDKATFGIFE